MAAPPTLIVQPDASGTTINTLPAVGQTTSDSSLPMVLASDQSPVPVAIGQASNLATNQASVGTTATLIVAARSGRRQVLLIQEGNGSGGTGTLVRVGASSVTTSTGIPLPGTAYSVLTIDGGAAVYGIVASGSQTVSYLEVY